ncbi:MAG: RebB family R body protein [Alphaproteobacteria bacterium]|nr:RebB family R body protein [Alphaproteobacteria bacterium]MBU1607363.1 RebB family R body protein [Alphaproteobacteria bacterium]
MPNQYVNDQIVESVANVVTLNVGQAPSQSSAMLDVAMAETIGMTMYNAVSRQQSSSTVGSAAVTTACAKMLQTPFPIIHLRPPIPPARPRRRAASPRRKHRQCRCPRHHGDRRAHRDRTGERRRRGDRDTQGARRPYRRCDQVAAGGQHAAAQSAFASKPAPFSQSRLEQM